MPLQNIVLYSHTGSGNHGCEALVRTTAALLKDLVTTPIKLISWKPEEDKRYMLDSELEIIPRTRPQGFLEHVMAKAVKALTGSLYLYDRSNFHSLFNIHDSLCISIGGDTYCYKDYADYGRANKYLTRQGNKTILWGCSIEPKLLEKKDVQEDLRRYSLITARETITYNAMKKMGLDNVVYCPDTAFLLPVEEVELDSRFDDGVIGINVSPMILEYERENGITMKNYINLIQYLIDNTDNNVALIPHVVFMYGDDLSVLRILKDYFKDSSRVFLVDENKKMNCCQLKYIIGHCQALVASRTHASIAGYSSSIPTLVTGYSIKAKGIATDIFGTDIGYVYPVQSIKEENELVTAFRLLMEQKDSATVLMNNYQQKSKAMYSAVKNQVQVFFDK